MFQQAKVEQQLFEFFDFKRSRDDEHFVFVDGFSKATILISLLGSSVPWNERLFLAWIAPRGIVLVAISGLFALRLGELGYADGNVCSEQYLQRYSEVRAVR